MPRITITLDEDTANRLRDAAHREGVPLSRYIAKKLRRQLEWSEEFLALAGSFPDFPDLDTLRPRNASPSPIEVK